MEIYPDYESNLSSSLNDDIFDGYFFKMNIFSRSVSYNFLKKIINKQKEIFIYSPFRFNLENFKDLQNFKIISKILDDKKVDINKLNAIFIMKLANYVTTNVILGTKSTKRFSDLLFMENKNYQPILDEDTFEKILLNQILNNSY